MTQSNRRDFLGQTLAASMAGWSLSTVRGADDESPCAADGLQLATFRFDVTPPMGHSCCGGWIKPVEAVDDPLEAVGFVLLGAGRPIVLCAVDWTGILNEAHVEWRRALAEAAGTTPDRVAVQCVHQHNAPFACLEAERIVQAQGDLPDIVDLGFYRQCLDRGRGAVERAIREARRVTHVATGQGKVEKVASNRRVSRDDSGKVKSMRGSSCRDAELIAMPEGLIDPWLKTVAFFESDKKIAACHYYSTHPMSYYGDGRVSSDFAGLARKQRQADEPDCLHVYFTGCAGNIAAGKYNDGSKEMRPVLTRRVYDGIVASEQNLRRVPVESVEWKTVELLPAPREGYSIESFEKQIADKSAAVVNRNRPSFQLSWLRRLGKRIPIVLSSLHFGEVRLLHLPSECFIEYQLRAQQMKPSAFVATAAYGDGGPWYIPVKEEYPNGGYEVGVAFSDPAIDDLITRGMERLL
jgi:hypothetical protein